MVLRRSTSAPPRRCITHVRAITDVRDFSLPWNVDLDGVQGGDSAAFVESISETD